MHRFPPEVRDFAGTFIVLQKARERADYALDGRYYKLDVAGLAQAFILPYFLVDGPED